MSRSSSNLPATVAGVPAKKACSTISLAGGGVPGGGGGAPPGLNLTRASSRWALYRDRPASTTSKPSWSLSQTNSPRCAHVWSRVFSTWASLSPESSRAARYRPKRCRKVSKVWTPMSTGLPAWPMATIDSSEMQARTMGGWGFWTGRGRSPGKDKSQ